MNTKRVAEFYGGLGDILWNVYTCDNYVGLDKLQEGEEAVVAVVSHNPHSVELFKWHRNAARIRLMTPTFAAPWTPQLREAAGVPPPTDSPLRGYAPVRFYPAPWDAEPLRDLRNLGQYIIFNVTAGSPARNIPPDLAHTMARMALDHGFAVVSIGRNYRRQLPHKEVVVCEERLKDVPGVVDMVDKMSVPGTAEALRGAAASVVCHSAMAMLSWYMRKPNFVAWPPDAAKDFEGDPRTSYGFGSHYPETRHTEFSKFDPGKFDQFLRLVKKERGRIREDAVEFLQRGGPIPK